MVKVIVSMIPVMTDPILNSPALWQENLPWPAEASHKYSRGHVLVQGGTSSHTGAAKMAARAALRAGAGAVTVLCDRFSQPIYAASFQAIMTRVSEDEAVFATIIQDKRVSAFLIGPGAGVSEYTKTRVWMGLSCKKPMVLDADALTVFSPHPQELFSALHKNCVLTPHEGEFARLFDLVGDRVARAAHAAKQSGAVLVLKGAETVIAAPDGRVAVNRMTSPFLATAGSGDVLGGIIAGLLAGGMPAFLAACAGVWLHGKAGSDFGPGLIAEDIPDLLPAVLSSLYAKADL